MPDVSVIIPTWNRAEQVVLAISSVLSQTYPVLEVLVCDDGSTDETAELINTIRDPRIRLLPGARGGRPAIPRNRGIRESRGQWLAFLDSDDLWAPNKLEKQFAALQNSNALAACSNATRKLPGQFASGKLLNWEAPRITFENLLNDNTVICSSVIAHRTLFAVVDTFPERAGMIEDFALWLRIASLTDFVYCNEELVIYSDNPSVSVRGTVTSNIWQQRREVLRDYLGWARASRGIPKDITEKVHKARLCYWRAVTQLLKQRVLRTP